MTIFDYIWLYLAICLKVPIEGILRRAPAEQLMQKYGVGAFADATQFLVSK